MILERVKRGEGVSVYKAEDGTVYLLRPVDRKYENAPKKPTYYLSAKQPGNTEAKYVSGLFPTKIKGLYSLDMKDELGVKHMYSLRFADEGSKAELDEGKADEKASVL